MKKEYVVFSQKLAGHLMQLGFVLKRMERTKQDESRRNVFVFNETDELVEAIHNYK